MSYVTEESLEQLRQEHAQELEELEKVYGGQITSAQELKEAMESGQYALRVARSVMDALAKAQALSFADNVGYRNAHRGVIGSAIREADIDYEKHSTLVRLDHSIQTLGKYLQDFAAELKDVSALPMENLPSTSFSDGLLFLDRWVEGLFAEIVVSVKLDNIQKKMMPLLGKLTPIVSGLEKEYAAREAVCKEIDEKIREIVLAQS